MNKAKNLPLSLNFNSTKYSVRNFRSENKLQKTDVAESLVTKSVSKFRVEDEFDPDLSSDIKGIMSELQQIRKKAQKDGQKTNEQTISSSGGCDREKQLARRRSACRSCWRRVCHEWWLLSVHAWRSWLV
ncbi:hypothetical protein OIU74_003169 [Salix koriyanagi]|uniref:Uncharacterized protein n=1 Tax=Salix koriyanagi TaxID=2511006 RepID=A0A9Q0ZKV2_9ROSI|nr:hypothetical protein OIU74_003169 [Salix koriyanagi]